MMVAKFLFLLILFALTSLVKGVVGTSDYEPNRNDNGQRVYPRGSKSEEGVLSVIENQSQGGRSQSRSQGYIYLDDGSQIGPFLLSNLVLVVPHPRSSPPRHKASSPKKRPLNKRGHDTSSRHQPLSCESL